MLLCYLKACASGYLKEYEAIMCEDIGFFMVLHQPMELEKAN